MHEDRVALLQYSPPDSHILEFMGKPFPPSIDLIKDGLHHTSECIVDGIPRLHSAHRDALLLNLVALL